MPTRFVRSKVLVCAAMLFWSAAAAGPALAQTAAEYNAAGVEQYQAEDWKRAVSLFESAYDLDPDNATIRKNLCNAYHAHAIELAQEGDLGAAVSQLELAISVNPENPLPLVQLGACYLRLGLVAEAVFRLEEAVELAPENLDAHYLLGEAYYDDNDVPSALAQWEYVRQQQPDRKGIDDRLEKAYRERAVEYNHDQIESRHFRVAYDPGARELDVGRVLTLLEFAYLDLGRQFGGMYPPAPIQVVLYTAEDFSKATQMGPHVGALYDGKIRVPFAKGNGDTLTEDDLKRLLYHEYTHVLVRAWVEDNIPWWMNEGLAETFSRGPLNHGQLDLLKQAKRENALFRLEQLDGDLLSKLSDSQLQLAYVQAHAAVYYLWKRGGSDALTVALNALAEGKSAQEALVHAYNLNLDLLQRGVEASIGQ